jgi:hypothetical protein
VSPRSPEHCRHDLGTTTFDDGDVCCDECGNSMAGESVEDILAAVWDEGYRACLRQWDRPANADRMPERNPYQ